MKSSKERLAEAQCRERVLKKTLVNDFITLKQQLLSIEVDNDLAKYMLETENGLIAIYPECKQYIDTLTLWPLNFDDYDTPLDFSES